MAVALLLLASGRASSGGPAGELVRTYHAGGAVASERTYRDGVKHGRHRAFWEDGTLRFEATFLDGAYDGTVRSFYAGGQPFELRHYVRGAEEGPQQIFEPDGTLRVNYVVRDGHRYGAVGARPCFTVRAGGES